MNSDRDFSAPFEVIRTGIWAQSLTCLGIIIISLLPNKIEYYEIAIKEIINMGNLPKNESDLLSRFVTTPGGHNCFELSNDQYESWLDWVGENDYVAERPPLCPGGASVEPRFLGLSSELSSKLAEYQIILEESSYLPPQGKIDRTFFGVAPNWSEYKLDASVGEILSYAGVGYARVGPIVPNYDLPWTEVELWANRILRGRKNYEIFLSQMPKITCSYDHQYCEIIIVGEIIPKDGIRATHGTSEVTTEARIPSSEMSGILGWFSGDRWFFVDGPTALIEVSSEISELTPVEATKKLRELIAHENDSGGFQALGVAIGKSVVPIVAPPLIMSLSAYAYFLSGALARIAPPKEAIQRSFVPTLFGGFGGFLLRFIVIVLLPIAAQLILLQKILFWNFSINEFDLDTVPLLDGIKLSMSLLSTLLTAVLGFLTISRFRRIILGAI